MFFGKREEHSITKWFGKKHTVKRVNLLNERYYWSTCFSPSIGVKLRWKKVIAAIAGMMVLMLMWKNTPVLFDVAVRNAALKQKPCAKCPPCNTYDEKLPPPIVLDYEAEIVHDEITGTTIGPPPNMPDQLYVRNLTEIRPLAEFSLTPWRVLESLSDPVDGKDCFHMKASKSYMAKWALVIFVKSTSSNFDRRTAVRSTWGQVYFLNQVRIDKIFVVGQVNDPAIQAELLAENDVFGDILQFEGPDDYKNMPIKVTTAMQWASEHLPMHYMYASSDDDFVVDFVSIIDFLEYEIKFQRFNEKKKTGILKSTQEIRANMPIYCVYYLDNIRGPNRDNTSKWFVNKSEYSLERYPPYCGGGFYLMPVSMARDLFEVSRRTKVLAMDDVWITGILRQKLGRGDDNVQKAQWPRETHPADKKPKLWIHLWGDYGKQKKDVAKLLPKAWKDWDFRLKGRPNCRWPDMEVDIMKLLEDEETVENIEKLEKLPIVAKVKT